MMTHELPVRSASADDYGRALLELAARRAELVLLAAANGWLGGVCEALAGRIVEVGTCERDLVTTAAALARQGRVPVVHASARALAFDALEPIRNEVAAWGLSVKLVAFIPERVGDGNGQIPSPIDDLALMRAAPGMQVFCPADVQELCEALPVILALPGPAYVRHTSAPPAVAHIEPFVIGRAEVVSSEDGISILCCGPALGEAERARAVLAARGVPVRLVNLRSLEPVDEEAIVDAVRPAELVVTLEDHALRGGLHSILAEVCLARRLAPRVLALQLGRRSGAARLGGRLEPERLPGSQVAESILKALCQTEAWA